MSNGSDRGTAALEITSVTKSYVDDGGEVVALDRVSLSIAPGEFICLLGPSGCGKTTLLNCLAGFVVPDAGSLSVAGQAIRGPGADRGVVFQDHGLLPWYTVAENIALGPAMAKAPRNETDRLVTKYITLVGLAGFERRYPAQLSGGMKQRVGIARALANSPYALLMDEPFGALDAQTRQTMQEELLSIWESERKTIVFVTHSIPEAIYLSDRIVVMSPRPGRIQAVIPVDAPRTRDRTSQRFGELYREIEDLMKSRR